MQIKNVPCMYLGIYVYVMYVCVHMHACIFVCTYAHVCMCICVYMCMYVGYRYEDIPKCRLIVSHKSAMIEKLPTILPTPPPYTNHPLTEVRRISLYS